MKMLKHVNFQKKDSFFINDNYHPITFVKLARIITVKEVTDKLVYP